MRGVYTVIFENVSVSAAQDLFELLAADDKPLAVVGLMISQISDVGDAAEEMLRLEIIRGFTGSGSGGSSATPAATDPSDGAASFTAEVNNTTLATTGTGTVLHADAFNIRSGFQMWWTPEAMLKCAQGGLLVMRFDAATARLVFTIARRTVAFVLAQYDMEFSLSQRAVEFVLTQ